MFSVTKEFHFEASHSLPHLPKTHKCRRPHGHSYKVVVEVQGELDERGFVIDYAEISDAVDPIIKWLDHQDLNDRVMMKTTAENLAKWIFDRASENIPVTSVTVHETPKTTAIYRPEVSRG